MCQEVFLSFLLFCFFDFPASFFSIFLHAVNHIRHQKACTFRCFAATPENAGFRKAGSRPAIYTLYSIKSGFPVCTRLSSDHPKRQTHGLPCMLSFVGPDPDPLSFRRFDQILPEIRMRDRDECFRPLPCSSSFEVDTPEFCHDEVDLGAGRGYNLAVEHGLHIGEQSALLILIGGRQAQECFSAL